MAKLTKEDVLRTLARGDYTDAELREVFTGYPGNRKLRQFREELVKDGGVRQVGHSADNQGGCTVPLWGAVR